MLAEGRNHRITEFRTCWKQYTPLKLCFAGGIRTLAILTLQPRFSYHTCIVWWLRCGVNMNKIGHKLYKLLSKNLRCWQDGITEFRTCWKQYTPLKLCFAGGILIAPVLVGGKINWPGQLAPPPPGGEHNQDGDYDMPGQLGPLRASCPAGQDKLFWYQFY